MFQKIYINGELKDQREKERLNCQNEFCSLHLLNDLYL
jgi:hypothetical protein